MANKRKTTTAIVAGVAAVALLLGGTFAWTSISQQAKNEAAGVVNVGGRLHDDFDGKNKDVYVENFTNPYDGGQPIYARVRLDEYMEVGKDAGGIDVDNDGTIDAVPVINGTDIDDVKTWKPHVPSTACETCNSGDTCLIHDHWTWTMGGDADGSDGSTIFMPTFNKDKDSLDADINGTYHGTDDTDKVYYDDYVVYTTDETGGVVNETDKEAYNGEIYSLTGDAQYDNDPDTDKNTVENDDYILKTETHTAKETATATVMTMQEWIDEGSTPGNFWVYDDDGWAYWANPIMPGEATGLLLDGINMTKNPGEKCYYAINVVGQFATVNDWEYFTDGGAPSDEAMELLTAASQNVATVTVTNVSGTANVDRGAKVNFEASISVNGTQVLAASDFEWSVLNADLTENTTSTITDGVLTVGASETSNNLIVVAKALDEKYLGALGMSSIAVKAPVNTEPDITLYADDTVYIPMKSGESKSYKLGSDGSTDAASFVVSKAYAKDESSTALTAGTDYTYNPATQILTLTQKAEGVRIEFTADGNTDIVYGLEVNVPVTPSMAGFMEEAYYNNTYLGVMALNAEENVFYRVNLTEDGTSTGTPLELSDIQLSGEYNNGVTYDPETNLLFIPEPSTVTTFLKAKYGESDVYILAMSEQSNQKALYLTNHDNVTGSSMTLEGGVYKGTYTPGYAHEIQADVLDPWTLVFETADGYTLDDGLAIPTMFFYSVEGAPADRGTSYLCVPEGYTGEIQLQGYYYDDSNVKHEVNIILTVE